MNLPLREFSQIVAAMRSSNIAPSGSEKRVASRMDVSARIQCHLLDGKTIKHSYSVWARDISLSGMGVIQSLNLPRGARIVIELPLNQGWIHVTGAVIRSGTIADGLTVIGIEFTSMADEELIATLARIKADESNRIQRMMMQ